MDYFTSYSTMKISLAFLKCLKAPLANKKRNCNDESCREEAPSFEVYQRRKHPSTINTNPSDYATST